MSTVDARVDVAAAVGLPPRFMLLFIAVQLAAGAIGHRLTADVEALPVIWPAAGVLYAAMLVAAPRTWPTLVLVAVLAQLAGDFAFSGGSIVAMGLQRSIFHAATTVLQAIAATWLFKQFAEPRRKHRSRVDNMVIGLVAAALGAAAGSLAAAVAGLLLDGVPIRWPTLVVWWSASLFAMSVLSPALIPMLSRAARNEAPRAMRTGRAFEYLAVTVLLACFVELVLGVDGSASAKPPPAMLLPLLIWPALLWLAVRFAPSWVALANALLGVLIAIGTGAQRGVFVTGEHTAVEVAISAQFYLCVTAIVTLSVATVMAERRRRSQQLRREVDFERLLSALSLRMRDAGPLDIDEKINQGLARIGQLVGALRCSLIFIDRTEARFDISHYWHAPEVGPVVHAMQSLSTEQFDSVAARLHSGEVIATSSLDELAPPGDRALRALRKLDLGSESLTLVPVSTGEVTALIAVTGWHSAGDSPAVHALLVMVAQLFVNALKRRDAERTNERYQHRLKSLASETLLAEERARRQTATHLHDSIGQNLAVLRIQVARMIEEGADRDQLEFAQRLVTESILSTRGLVRDLSPSVLYELGLAPALAWLTERLSREYDIAITFEPQAELPDIAIELRTLLFQAGREFCMNAVKHAAASRLTMSLQATSRTMTLALSDNGRGFDPRTADLSDTSGFGLFSLRERLVPVNGTLNVESREREGTRVSVEIPLATS